MENNTCHICGASQAEGLFQKQGHWICKCPGCGVVFLASWPQRGTAEELYDEEYFNEHCLTPQKWQIRFSREYAARLKMIEKMKPEGRLLDVGSGPGSFLLLAQNRGWQVEGVETSQFAAKFSRQNLGLKVFCSPIEQAPLKMESFDVITAWELIEHLANPIPLLNRINRLLKKDGILAISTPNYTSFPSKLQKENWPAYHFFYHINFFSQASLTNLLDKVGFVPIRVVKDGCCCPSFTFGIRRKLISCCQGNTAVAGFIDKYLTWLKKYAVYMPANLFLKALRVEGDRLIIYAMKK